MRKLIWGIREGLGTKVMGVRLNILIDAIDMVAKFENLPIVKKFIGERDY